MKTSRPCSLPPPIEGMEDVADMAERLMQSAQPLAPEEETPPKGDEPEAHDTDPMDCLERPTEPCDEEP